MRNGKQTFQFFTASCTCTFIQCLPNLVLENSSIANFQWLSYLIYPVDIFTTDDHIPNVKSYSMAKIDLLHDLNQRLGSGNRNAFYGLTDCVHFGSLAMG